MDFLPYRRASAVYYAHQWAYTPNPMYYDYSGIGGDCTNFASQCLFAGTGVMNYTPIFGWYYIDADNKAPAWTGVEFLRNFLIRDEQTPGPLAEETSDLSLAQPGDILQLRFAGDVFQHSTVIVAANGTDDPASVRVAAHSLSADFKPLDGYAYTEYRLLHILGYYG